MGSGRIANCDTVILKKEALRVLYIMGKAKLEFD